MTSSSYEIFQGSPSDPLWLESLDDLDTASLRMKERAEIRPGPYFIYSADSGRILETIDTSSQNGNKQPQ
jgi:hypothetical protein